MQLYVLGINAIDIKHGIPTTVYGMYFITSTARQNYLDKSVFVNITLFLILHKKISLVLWCSQNKFY